MKAMAKKVFNTSFFGLINSMKFFQKKKFLLVTTILFPGFWPTESKWLRILIYTFFLQVKRIKADMIKTIFPLFVKAGLLYFESFIISCISFSNKKENYCITSSDIIETQETRIMQQN